VHLKENQVLKYLNEGSCHTSSCFKSIPHGVLRRLSRCEYPEHKKALEHAKLPVPKTYPKLQESLKNIHEREATRNNPTDESRLAEKTTSKETERQRPK
jgi:hypothetical protein